MSAAGRDVWSTQAVLRALCRTTVVSLCSCCVPTTPTRTVLRGVWRRPTAPCHLAQGCWSSWGLTSGGQGSQEGAAWACALCAVGGHALMPSLLRALLRASPARHQSPAGHSGCPCVGRVLENDPLSIHHPQAILRRPVALQLADGGREHPQCPEPEGASEPRKWAAPRQGGAFSPSCLPRLGLGWCLHSGAGRTGTQTCSWVCGVAEFPCPMPGACMGRP